jgi:hypothetical protein
MDIDMEREHLFGEPNCERLKRTNLYVHGCRTLGERDIAEAVACLFCYEGRECVKKESEPDGEA